MNKDNKFTVLIFLGPPGSGKGTQVEFLSKKFGFHHLISSSAGKEYMETHDDRKTRKQKERFDKGLLWDPKWVLAIIKEKTMEILEHKHETACPGIIYDGTPRTLYEAKKLFKFLVKKIGKENIKVVEMQVNKNELLERIEKRLICDTGDRHVFIRDNELQPGSACPKGDGVLKTRDMDTKDIFETRMEEYEQETMRGIEFLRKKHGVFVINGNQGMEEVHQEILRKVFGENDNN